MKATQYLGNPKEELELNVADIVEYSLSHDSGQNGEKIRAKTKDGKIFDLKLKFIGKKKFEELRNLIKEKGKLSSKHPHDFSNSYHYYLVVVEWD